MIIKKIKEVVDETKFRQRIKPELFQKILKENLAITNEKVLIVGDKGQLGNMISPILTNAYSLAAKDLGLDFETVYQNFKGRGDYADEVLVKKMDKLPRNSVIILNVSNRVGNLQSLGLSFRKFAKSRGHRFISSSSLGSISNDNLDMMIKCLDLDYDKIEKETEIMRKKLSLAKEIHVTTKNGTDLTYNVDGITAVSATGVYKKPGDGGNLPGSEAYIAPNGDNVNGTLVIDGSARIKNKTIIIRTPIRMEIRNGLIVNMNNSLEAQKLKETLRWAHNNSKNPKNVWKIGEFGIGLNKKAKIIGATIIDEKAYGTVHFAIGSNSWFGGKIKTIIHLDQVIRNPTIKLDGKILKY